MNDAEFRRRAHALLARLHRSVPSHRGETRCRLCCEDPFAGDDGGIEGKALLESGATRSDAEWLCAQCRCAVDGVTAEHLIDDQSARCPRCGSTVFRADAQWLRDVIFRRQIERHRALRDRKSP